MKVVKLYYDWSKSTFPSKVDKKICFGGSLSATCYPCKAWPRNLSAISTTSNVGCMNAHTCMHTAENWKKYIDFFYFLKTFLSLSRDKYFALYWCFCVRISFILLLIKWSEMDPNVKPQTLVETFDRANYNSIPEYNVAIKTLLTYLMFVLPHVHRSSKRKGCFVRGWLHDIWAKQVQFVENLSRCSLMDSLLWCDLSFAIYTSMSP